VLVLTALRIVWWWRFDRKPDPTAGSPHWQERAAQTVHILFYVVLVGMIASGIGMMVLSGAGPIIFGGQGAALPDFSKYLPRAPHGIGARILIALVVLHAGAALYHQFGRRDGLLRRMWFGK
jgi:cytochrome b561